MSELVPLTRRHLDAMGITEVPSTIQGVALIEGDTVLAVGGCTLGAGHYVLVSNLSPELRTRMQRGRCTKALLRAARHLLKYAIRTKLPIYALADPEFHGSATLLTHLGFVPHSGNTYKWLGSR